MAYDRTTIFLGQPQVLDIGTCWTCNNDYVVKVKEREVEEQVEREHLCKQWLYKQKHICKTFSYSSFVSPFSHLGIVSHR